jgi:hypothetical protein
MTMPGSMWHRICLTSQSGRKKAGEKDWDLLKPPKFSKDYSLELYLLKFLPPLNSKPC